jgi:hypothetical protein
MVNTLAGYINFVSTVLYMPFISRMVTVLSNVSREGLASGVSGILQASLAVVGIVVFVPFCLFVSQNNVSALTSC